MQDTLDRVANGQVLNISSWCIDTHPRELIFKSFHLVDIGSLTFLKALEPAAVVIKWFARMILSNFDLRLAIDIYQWLTDVQDRVGVVRVKDKLVRGQGAAADHSVVTVQEVAWEAVATLLGPCVQALVQRIEHLYLVVIVRDHDVLVLRAEGDAKSEWSLC